jgi:DNA-directed RNA polymerase subunit L
MSYKLYTDKQETFECKIFLEGASLTNSIARILIENNDINLVFNGSVDKDGNCKVPIKKLKGLVGENTTGNMKLEVIAEDVYFKPWESDFIVETSKKVTVEVKEQKISNKPKIQITEIKQKPKKVVKKKINIIENTVKKLKNNGVTFDIIKENKEKFIPMLNEFAIKTKYKNNRLEFVKKVLTKLSDK